MLSSLYPNLENKWNYSKLSIWELIEYDKVIFIDSDLVVLKNMDRFFVYPQLSAAGNDKWFFRNLRFNSSKFRELVNFI